MKNSTPLTSRCKEKRMEMRVDDLQGAEIIALLKEHLAWMEKVSPPESRHALDLGSLQRPEITFWTIWRDAELAGCGALKALDAHHAELKSMRTAQAHQRQGVASILLYSCWPRQNVAGTSA